MSSDYFDFANKPKGILPFIITELIATPVEEHLYECCNYSSSNGISLHFTVSETQQQLFETIVDAIKGKVEKNLAHQ
jgi:hypothetical protein